MSREIKFRAWDGLNRHMFYPAFLEIESNHVRSWTGAPNGGLGMGYNAILMQYTGLKDKNGKEIYEGDIVETVYTDHKKHKGVIYSQPTRLNWSVKHSPFANQDLFVYSRPDCSVEIIGNIYENPELLEG